MRTALSGPPPVARFTPYPLPVLLHAATCALIRIGSGGDAGAGLKATFSSSPGSELEWKYVDTFQKVLAFRTMDEMIWNISGENRCVGLIHDGFCYTVDRSLFGLDLNFISQYYPGAPGQILKQYSFLSMSECLDVISYTPPTVETYWKLGPKEPE
jgi:hypothetical protein